MRWNSLWIGSISLVACLSSYTAAQTPLPQHLKVSTFGHFNADVVYPPTKNGEFTRAELTFANDSQVSTDRVKIKWKFKSANDNSGSKQTEHEVSFLPTSVTGRTGGTTTLYVTGWSESESKVIVEEWELADLALVEALLPSGITKVTLAGPNVKRTRLAELENLTPIYCAAANPWTDELYLLDSATPRTIHRLDLTTGKLKRTPLLTEADEPALGGQRSLLSGLTKNTGFIMFTKPLARWEDPTGGKLPATLVAFIDTDADGDFETVAPMDLMLFGHTFNTQSDLQWTEPEK
jgi:hypothetical protein